ncbi:MAG: shikimate dehydrogenase [Thiotrichaceae bacterium]|nr:shikimate dehydrogenase [Thiotrichaceae bacterium]
MTDLYAVVGNPIAHSKSPLIHSLFAKQTQQEIEYTTLLSPMDDFTATIRQFFSQNSACGLNITVPFKLEAYALCEELSDYAKQAGAVNTLYKNEQGYICGTNTDGIGIVRDLLKNNVVLKNKKILIIGAGGAVRGVIAPLLEQQVAQIVIANRTVSKAQALVSLFNINELSASGLDDIPALGFDLVINGTATSLEGKLPKIDAKHIVGSKCCYDMMYAAGQETAFVTWAKDLGVGQCLDGLGMLVEQAAESFFIWRGVRPDTTSVLDQLR